MQAKYIKMRQSALKKCKNKKWVKEFGRFLADVEQHAAAQAIAGSGGSRK